VLPYAVQHSYGGPDGLKRLVEACHDRGMAFVLDVVYNHLGPEGNHLGGFGPYFTDRYTTPWGPAVNFDGAGSDEVRRYFVNNALEWFEDFHVDALRLDAIHGIVDVSPHPFLAELAEETHALGRRLGRRLLLIAESELGDVRVVTGRDQGGLGLDAQWADDFHHAVHAHLTGERTAYYRDFGRLGQLAKAFRSGFVLTGEHSVYRDRRHGSDTKGVPSERFVVASQTHDQVGNRMLGERLSSLVSFEQAKLAAACVLLSPFVPLLFMGEEYAEPAPFLYFVSHTDPELVEAVRAGRREEFAGFHAQGEDPDPQAEETFLRSKLQLHLRDEGRHRQMLEWYRALLALRRSTPALSRLSKDDLEVAVDEPGGLLLLWRWSGRSEAVAAFNLADHGQEVRLPIEGSWGRALDSEDVAFGGSGTSPPDRVDVDAGLSLKPRSVVVLTRSRGART
jgi:maltooligosyltrehalose trehalohydrolase